MRAKLMTSAAVLAGALAFATMAQAQTTSSGPNGNVGGNATATDSYNSTDLDLGIADSGNDNSVNDSGNDNSTDLSLGVADSFNDNSTNVADSGNDNSTNVGITDSFNDNSTWRVSLSNQSLAANVSDLSFDLSESGDGPQNGRIRSGDISQSGGAFAGFAGIQTVSNISGQASVGQAATAISANANVTFGAGGGN